MNAYLENIETKNVMNDVSSLTAGLDFERESIGERRRMPILPYIRTISHHFNESEFILRLPSNDNSSKLLTEEFVLDNDDDDEFCKTFPSLSMSSLSLLKINNLQQRSDPSLSLRHRCKQLKKNKRNGYSIREGVTMANVAKVTPENNRNNSCFEPFVRSLSPTSPSFKSSSIKSIHHATPLSQKQFASPTISSSRSKSQRMLSTTEFVYETPIKSRSVCGRRFSIENNIVYGNDNDPLKDKMYESVTPPPLLKKMLFV